MAFHPADESYEQSILLHHSQVCLSRRCQKYFKEGLHITSFQWLDTSQESRSMPLRPCCFSFPALSGIKAAVWAAQGRHCWLDFTHALSAVSTSSRAIQIHIDTHQLAWRFSVMLQACQRGKWGPSYPPTAELQHDHPGYSERWRLDWFNQHMAR